MHSSLHSGIKLEITKSKITTQSLKVWKLINTLLNNPLVKEKFTKDMRKYYKLKNNTIYQNLWNAAKAVFKGKFKTIF